MHSLQHLLTFYSRWDFSHAIDCDVWMQLHEMKDSYDYICTHMDDFKIVAKEPEQARDQISSSFLLKTIGPPPYYLGNEYNWSVDEKAWVLGCATYIRECIHQLEDNPSFSTLHPHESPLPAGCHPELDESQPLDLNGIRKYQMLIGMAQWACTIGPLIMHLPSHPWVVSLQTCQVEMPLLFISLDIWKSTWNDKLCWTPIP